MKPIFSLLLGVIFLPSFVLGKSPALGPSFEELIAEARRQNLDDEPEWRRLLHMRKTLWGASKSDIDGPGFFLSTSGRKNPQAELEATLKGVCEPIPDNAQDDHAQCRYPARFAWLQQKIPAMNLLPRASCGRFQSWQEKLAPEKVSLVFASYYMNNPASMYGHTFLRLHRKGKEGDAHLLDYTINFSANATTTNGILFALLGLTGGFRGVFSTEPYYVKVQKYNNLESRDLWEYELDIDEAGLERLVAHLWEMGHTSMAYYFLNKNCSYQLLPMLEVARLDLDLSLRFGARAIPLDTLRSVLDVPGLVTKTSFRPSHLRRMRAAREKLSTREQDIARDYVQKPHQPRSVEYEQLPMERRPLVLDAAYEYLRYRSGFYSDQPEDVKETEHKLLTLRNQFPPPSPALLNSSTPNPPEAAHKTGLFGFGFGVDKLNTFEELSIRGSLHDLESDPEGFIEGSQLEMFSARIRHDNELDKTYLDEGTLVQVKSLTPWEPWVRVPSWGVKFGFETAHDLNRVPHRSQYFGLSGGSGATFRIPRLAGGFWYGMINGDSGIGGIFEKHYRLGLGATNGVILNPLSFWRVHFSASYMRYGAGAKSNLNSLRLVQSWSLFKNTELRLDAERVNSYQEGVLKINQFF